MPSGRGREPTNEAPAATRTIGYARARCGIRAHGPDGFCSPTCFAGSQAMIEESACIDLSERDSLLELSLLENPPAPARLRAAIAALTKPKRKRR